MQGWLEGIAGPDFAPALMWTLVALIALLIVLVIVRIVRGLTFGTFVAGGRNRKARLAVMDATAVDSQRRLVLVRRDDVEHLILIGGPSDVVVEQNIRLLPPARKPAEEEHTPQAARHRPETPAAAPVAAPRPQPQPAPPPPVAPPVAPAAARPVAPQRPVAPPPPPYQPPAPRPAPPAQPSSYAPASETRTLRPVTQPAPVVAPAPAVTVTPVSAPAPQRAQDLDNALLEELKVSLQNDRAVSTANVDISLDEEMSKLLNDLSGEKQRS